MTKYLLLIILLALSTCQECFAGYTIHVDSQVPEFRQVNGPYGPEVYPSSTEAPPAPATYGAELCRPDNYNPFSTDSARRTRVFRDNYGVASSSAILAVCPQFKESLAKKIRAEGSRRLEVLTPYSAAERNTWTQQQKEAEEYRADTNCPCFMIRQIAAGRGIAVEILVGKIEENIALYPAAAGQILGQQQRLLDRLDAETDIDRLQAITWP